MLWEEVKEEMKIEQKSNFKEFIQYTTSSVLGMIGLSCYILADTYFISKGLGAKGLAALNLAIPIYSFVHGSGLMLGIGGAAKYSIFKGQKAYQNVNKVFSNIVYAACILAILFMLAGIFLSGKITMQLGANMAIFHMTKIYLQMILLFAPALIMNDILICFVRNDGNPRLSMLAMLIGSFSNILLDYIFIFPLNMGIFGAVLATGFAPIISMVILSKHWITKQNQFHLEKIRPSFLFMAHTISLGIPSLIAEVASGIVIIVFNVIILSLQGNIGVAAYGVVANLSLVVTAIYTGIAQGMQPITSRAYGYNDKNTMKQTLKYAMITMLLFSGCIYTLFWMLTNPIVGIFNSEQNMQLQQIAVIGLKLYFTAIPFVGFNIIIAMYFISVEKAIPAQIVSLFRGFFLIIPMAFLLSFFIGMVGVWLTYPITEGIVAFIGILLYKRFNRNRVKK